MRIMKNRIMKFIVPHLSLLMALCLVILVSILMILDHDMESHIGDSIVINGDSLIVVGIDDWSSNYVLSNGLEVHRSVVEYKAK